MISGQASTLAALLVLSLASPAPAQDTGIEPFVAELRNTSARARERALDELGRLGRPEAAVPIAATLSDTHDGVQSRAIAALLGLYTVRADLGARQWGPGSVGKSATFAETAFEAGPLATMPAVVPAEVLTGLAAVVRQDESVKTRLEAAYALGTLGAPFMGPMPAAAVTPVATELAAALLHPDRPTRQVVARIAGRVFAPTAGRPVPTAIGDALINSMNDGDPLVRRWAMDSLGWLKYDRAIQALTERASYHGRNEEGSAALHALARIAAPSSGPVFKALLSSGASTFRVISIEGLGRINDTTALAAIAESAASARQVNVTLAYRMAEILMAQTSDVTPIAAGLRSDDTAIQARVYLAELAERQPNLLYPLLRSTDAWVRRGTAELLGTTRRPAEEGMLQPLLTDPAPEVIEAASEAIRRLRAWAASHPAP
jgi:HEAT repeat protein